MGVNSYRIACVVLIIGWTVSLILEVATYGTGRAGGGTLTGLDVLVWGWSGIGEQNGWYANVIFIAATASLLAGGPISPRKARVAMWFLLLFLANALFWRSVPRIEVGGTLPIDHFGPGYCLWFAVQLSMAAMLWRRSRHVIEEQSE